MNRQPGKKRAANNREERNLVSPNKPRIVCLCQSEQWQRLALVCLSRRWHFWEINSGCRSNPTKHDTTTGLDANQRRGWGWRRILCLGLEHDGAGARFVWEVKNQPVYSSSAGLDDELCRWLNQIWPSWMIGRCLYIQKLPLLFHFISFCRLYLFACQTGLWYHLLHFQHSLYVSFHSPHRLTKVYSFPAGVIIGFWLQQNRLIL